MTDSASGGLQYVDEGGGWFYFVSNASSPVERALYRDRLEAPGKPQRLTPGAGWHTIAFADGAPLFLDTWSTTEQPPRLALHAADGKPLAELDAESPAARPSLLALRRATCARRVRRAARGRWPEAANTCC